MSVKTADIQIVPSVVKKNRCALHAAHAIWYFMINVCYDLKKKWKVRETNFQSQFYEKITFSRLSLRCQFIQI